ncbi:MAG: glycosyltransferase [Lawsonibacter sp.]|nr:glycosyltransferase [Lawsonibacter sp.]
MEEREKRDSVAVVVPSLNPDRRLRSTVEGLLSAGFTDVILVNDGSSPETLEHFQALAHLPEVTLLSHTVNRGKGAALKTAFSWLLEHRPFCAGVVTVDGDGQHHPEDAAACARQMLAEERVILGCRDFSRPEVPPRSRMGNRITSAVFHIFCGMKISDTQTGLRAIPRRDLAVMAAVAGERYEYETNMLLVLKDRHIPYGEAPIRTIYLEENRGSHFHAVRDSWRIYRLILAHFFRYTLSSLASAAADTGLFGLLSFLLAGLLTGAALTAAAAAGARVLSSLLNFSLNRWVVFRGGGPLGRSLIRYYMLALPMLLAQFLLTEGVFRAARISDRQTLLRTAVYAAVMTALFVGSYVIQHRWVFQAGKTEERKPST